MKRTITHPRRAAGFDSMRVHAFDAAGASGLAFLQGQLELIDPDPVEPLQGITHPRDLAVEVGGGFPEFISAFGVDYRSVGTGTYGLQRNAQTEAATVQANVTKALYNTHLAAYNMAIGVIDLEKLEFAKRVGQPIPFSLQQMYEEAVYTTWNKALDYVAYLGFNGSPGLVNNASVPEVTLPNGAASQTTWASKTVNEILSDVLYLINIVAANSAYDETQGLPNRLLLPWSQYGRMLQPMSIGGVGYQSTIEYIEQHVGRQYSMDFKIHRLPGDWIAGKGAGNTDRCVLYRNDKKAVYLKVPQPVKKMMTVQAAIGAGAYVTTYAGCVSQVIWKRTQTAVYGDGI